MTIEQTNTSLNALYWLLRFRYLCKVNKRNKKYYSKVKETWNNCWVIALDCVATEDGFRLWKPPPTHPPSVNDDKPSATGPGFLRCCCVFNMLLKPCSKHLILVIVFSLDKGLWKIMIKYRRARFFITAAREFRDRLLAGLCWVLWAIYRRKWSGVRIHPCFSHVWMSPWSSGSALVNSQGRRLESVSLRHFHKCIFPEIYWEHRLTTEYVL